MLKKREEKLFERLAIGLGSQLVSYANQRLKGLKFADCLVYRKVTFRAVVNVPHGDSSIVGVPDGGSVVVTLNLGSVRTRGRPKGDSFEEPADKRQIYNAKAIAKHQGQEYVHKANFADEVAAVEEQQHRIPFVRLIIRQSQKAPCVILYTEDHLNDVKIFCGHPLSGDSTVLGIDKTSNLGNVYVTVTVYECHLSVKRQRTDEFPILCRPILLHDNSDRETFLLFFHHLLGSLAGCAQCPVLGSDEEKALRQAMSFAFPKSPRLPCTQHLKKNFKHALADKVGMPQQQRQKLVSRFVHLLVLLPYLTVT
ncbi:hypothetical protein PoB_002142200 [Plakobranchus ocellatus]|uniref:MULE transposase domain-containing protein n=1 Tax=Plakobranchus ocellatus TaxID=259542 RepID=A0AAV3ZK54_9GAST|nr:hypothetical protein PoB_002142200 [Plakobranchus ocellatus]